MLVRTPLYIDDNILEKASLLTGVKSKTALVHLELGGIDRV